jgi:phospholipid/cholesterol/gamma-HCH transport system substrate-binding protein
MRALELKVGLLIVTDAAILAGFIFVLGAWSVGKGYNVYVDFTFSGNLQPGAPVKVSGIKVGKVDDVSFLGGQLDEKSGRRVQVRVKAWVEERVRDAIREDAEFFVNTQGVLGEQYLEIVPGSHERPPLGADKIVVGVDPPRTDLIVARLYEFLDSTTKLLSDDKDLIRDLLKNSASAVSELNTLLVENRAELGELIRSSARFADEGAGLLHDVRGGLGDARAVGRLIAGVEATLTSARGSIDALTPRAVRFLDEGTRVAGLVTEPRLERVLAAADQGGALLGRSLPLVDNLNGMLTDLRAGKGTAGALLARDELYADIKEMVRDLKRNPWKFLWKE